MTLKSTLTTLGLSALLSLPSLAGNGTFQTKEGRRFVNLTIAFKGAISDANINRWKDHFTTANERLYRATAGQLQFGDIRFGRDTFTERRADIVISQTGHAHVTGDVVGSSMGTKEQLKIFTADDLDGPQTTVHEFGHYAFGLWDEYKGSLYGVQNGVYRLLGPATEESNTVFCVSKGENPNLASIMWDSNKVEIAHFCMGANHRKEISIGNGQVVRSFQQEKEGRDCWASIAEYAGLTAPTEPPTFNEKPPAPPNFKELSGDAVTVYLIQSTSGLTLGTTKVAITDGISRLRGPKAGRPTGDFAGVMTYNSDGVDTNLSIREFRTAAQRSAANTLVKAIPASNVPDCDAAVALRAARDAINTEEAKYATGFAAKTIVLFSDNRGTDGIDDALIEELKQSNIGVNVLELFVSQDDRLKNLSARTLGRHAPSKFKRPAVKVLAKVETDAVETNQAQNDVGAGMVGQFRIDGFEGDIDSTTPQTQQVAIDSFVNSVTFELSTVFNPEAASANPLELEIRDPSGNLVDLVNPPANVEVTVSEVDAKTVTIQSPAVGNWTCKVSAPGDPTRYALDIFGEGDALLSGNKADAIKGQFPAATPIRVTLGTAQNIMGAQVDGKVFRPDGSELPITLFDDGDAAHGDQLANDGIYSVLFNDYVGPGDYLVSIQAKSTSNTQFTTVNFRGDAAGGFTPGPTGPCPAFQRELNMVISCLGNTGTGSGLLPLANFEVLSGGGGSVTLRWRNPNPGGTEVVVQRSFKVGQWADLITLPAGATEYTDLNPGTTNVFYRVLAKSATGRSLPSDFQQLDLALVAKAFQEAAAAGGIGASGFSLGNGDSGGFCFIATAAYGSYLDPHVNSLRRFRDQQLRPLPGGPELISAYYQVSPALANYLVLHPWTKVPTRAALTVVVAAVEYPWAAGVLTLGGVLAYRRRRRQVRAAEPNK
ncbi:VWA domain-containing protein [bacterium]|nr:VWA domain-containing protein [bacterium]